MAATPWRRILFGFALIFCIGPAAAAEPVYPQLSGRIVDDADLLNAADRAELDAELKALEDKSSDQVVVVTLPSLQGFTIEDFGYQLGRHWGIGTKENDNGVLLIVAPNERKVRIEVGRGLEPILTDAMSNVIINGAILPRFRNGDYAGGIKEGAKGIELVLTGDSAELAERVNARRRRILRGPLRATRSVAADPGRHRATAAPRGCRRCDTGRRGDTSRRSCELADDLAPGATTAEALQRFRYVVERDSLGDQRTMAPASNKRISSSCVLRTNAGFIRLYKPQWTPTTE